MTGYYGAGSTPSRGLQFGTTADGVTTAVTTQETADAFSRYDIEFLARYLMAPTISVTGGFRTFNFTDKQTTSIGDIFPNTIFEDAFRSSVNKVDNQFYLAEIGVLFSTPFSASGRHLLFGGTTLGIGAATSHTSREDVAANGIRTHSRSSAVDFAATLDVYAGYQFLLTQSVALNIRYRAIMLAAREIPGQVGVNHGPEIGITTRF